MLDIAIIGAGELGGAIAHVLARRNAAAALRLVDAHGRVAEGKALDIAQAAPVEGFATIVTGSTELTTAGGADILILADRFGEGEWHGEDGVRLVARLAEIAPAAVILCAGWSQCQIVERSVDESHLDRRRVIGTAPEALGAAARALVALAANASPGDVALTVVGNPPKQLVILWDEAAIGGLSLKGVIDDPARRRLTAQVAALWPPGPHALAAVAAKAVDAVAGKTRAAMSCFVAPDYATGRRARAVALPVRLGRRGIDTIIDPLLSVVERVALDNAMLL